MTDNLPPRRATVLVFALTLFVYAYFYQGGGPNQFSRLALSAALAREGTVCIDGSHQLTVDKAFKDGHYYSDKAPGLSFLAAPVYWLVRLILGLLGGDGTPAGAVDPRVMLNWLLYFMTLVTVSLPTAAAMAAFYRRVYQESGPWAAFWVTLALGVGSPLTVYASLFYSHALTASLLLLAFLLITRPRIEEPDATPTEPLPLWRFALAGFLAGWATLTEMPAVLITGLLFLHVCFTQPRFGRAASAFVGGGLPCLALLLTYNTAAFGSPFSLGYQHMWHPQFQADMGEGLVGVTVPTPGDMFEMLVGTYRGLLVHWPFFILCVIPAVVVIAVRRSWDSSVLLALAAVAVYYLLNSGTFLRTSGFSFGPRHMVPCLPFAAYLVSRAYVGVMHYVVPAVTAISIAVVLLAVSTMPEFPTHGPRGERLDFPLKDYAWPRFIRGILSVKAITPNGQIVINVRAQPGELPYYDACNLAELVGLEGLLSLLPLLLVGSLLGVALAQAGAAEEGIGPPP